MTELLIRKKTTQIDIISRLDDFFFLFQPFNETVNVCHTPVVRKCGNEPVGPEICSTHYETNCETKYKTYEIEQDEPVCVMEVMTKCNNVTCE